MENIESAFNNKIERGVNGELNISVVFGALEALKNRNENGENFSEVEWNEFESSLESLGFVKVEDEKKYLASISMLHGNDVLVRRTDMKKILDDIEHDVDSNITLFDSEPNATLLGKHAEGISSALNSGFGWVVEGKVAGVFGFTNEYSHLSVKDIDTQSMSHHKEHGELMKKVSGDLKKEDVIFTLFRIHKSIFPESLLSDGDYDDMGEVNSFIVRLYKKNRQTH